MKTLISNVLFVLFGILLVVELGSFVCAVAFSIAALYEVSAGFRVFVWIAVILAALASSAAAEYLTEKRK